MLWRFHFFLHDGASRGIFFTEVITWTHVTTSIPTTAITIINGPSIVAIITWGWPTITRVAWAPTTTLRAFSATSPKYRVSQLWWTLRWWTVWWWTLWLCFFWFFFRLFRLFWFFLRLLRFFRLFRLLGLLRFFRLFLWLLRFFWLRLLNLLDLNALNGRTLANYLLLNLFRRATYHFD